MAGKIRMLRRTVLDGRFKFSLLKGALGAVASTIGPKFADGFWELLSAWQETGMGSCDPPTAASGSARRMVDYLGLTFVGP